MMATHADSALRRDGGSFRDPAGHVYARDRHIYRTVYPMAAGDYEAARDSGYLKAMTEAGWIVGATEVHDAELAGICNAAGDNPRYILQHPRLPFVSYPYEWCFSALRAAALRHLALQLQALRYRIALSDATAYNMQFLGVDPVHIDILSFRRYQPGEIWIGHDQFFRQFLNPLLLEAVMGIPFQAWYRGAINGIAVDELNRAIPITKKLTNLRLLLHIVLRASIDTNTRGSRTLDKLPSLDEKKFHAILEDLQDWISGLKSALPSRTRWADYAENNSYDEATAIAKQNFVSEFVAAARPHQVWDLGANTGVFSKIAARNGATSVIAFDSDRTALENLFRAASEQKLRITPLYMDLSSPSPRQGWAERERMGIGDRAKADAIFALAILHHLAISGNIPLDDAVAWLMSLAPQGIIEFVPKSDPMVIDMLALRTDIFPDYTEESFCRAVAKRGRILRQQHLKPQGRLLISFSTL